MLAVTAAVALDLGTTSIKAGLLSAAGEMAGVVARPAPGVKSEGGRYESDALAYAQAADEVLAECLVQMGRTIQADERPPLGLCCQRSSFLIWERATGRPVTPLISWQDDRGVSSCEALRMNEDEIRALSGLPLTPYYFAPKLHVLLQENPAWRERLGRGEWLLGTLDTFLIWRWTEGRHYRTDASMAARTLLMDVQTRQWSPRLCALFGVPREALPEICDSTGWALPLNNGLTLMASVADQSAALAASIAAGSSDAMVNLGTGGFVIRHLPDGCAAPEGYLQTLLWQDGDGLAHFACEGTLNSIASALASYPATDCRAEELGCSDIYCLAEPSGLGAPYFRKDIGLAFSTSVEGLSPRHVATLLLEGIVFRVARMLEDMHEEFGIERVYLSGGLSNLACLQQGIAGCVPFADIYLLPQPEAGLAGAAKLAAGMPSVVERDAGKIAIIRAPLKLSEKYARWSVWLDGLLNR